jgi:hypothetical protein
VIVAPLCLAWTPPEYAIYAPLAVIPAALPAFWGWRATFRRAWVADGSAIPDRELSNEDWRIGLIVVGAIIVVVGLGMLLQIAGF